MAFQETEPVKTLKMLSDFGLLKIINPKLIFNKELETVLKSMHETLSWFNLLFLDEKTDKGILYLMALLSGLKVEEINDTIKRLSPPPKEREIILKGMSQARNVLKRFPLRDPVELYRVLSTLKLETVLFSMALSKDIQTQKAISKYLTELRKIKTFLKGSDLKRMGIQPGPIYSEILEKLLDEKLRGNVKSLEDEERFVMEQVS